MSTNLARIRAGGGGGAGLRWRGATGPAWTGASLVAGLLLALGAACSGERGSGGSDAGASPLPDDAGTVVPADAGPPPQPGPDGGRPDAGRPELRIRSILPSRGPAAGATSVTIEGGGFYVGFASGATAAKKDTHIHFGSNEVAKFDIIDDDTLELVTPPHPAGTVDVVLENPNDRVVCADCFTYYVDLELSSAAPASGPIEGGNELELKGGAFSPAVTVLVGGKASPVVTVVDDATVKAVAPPGDAAGPVDLVVFNKNGIAEIRRGYRYLEAARIDRLEPPYGPLAGGATTRLAGASLAGATRVLFGQAVATFAVLGDGSLEATVPAAAQPGAVDVVVETPSGTAVRRAGFVYYDPGSTDLAIAGVWPTHGPPAGGNTIAIVGSGFDGQARFQIGGADATIVGTPTSNVASVVVPAGAANRWVGVSARGETASASLPDGYHYNLGLGAISPASGAAAGGEPVTLTGDGFVDGLELQLGALPATSVTASSAISLSATTPAGTGAVDVRLRDPADPENEAVLPQGFRFIEPVRVARVAPEIGSRAGGTYVTVLGTGFGEGASVHFGAGTLKDLQVVNGYTIVGRTPPGQVGSVDVTLKKGAEQDVSPGAFTYFDPTIGGGGSGGGPLNGTLNVTVLRWDQDPIAGATVMLGLDALTPFQGLTDSHGQITFSDPSLVKSQTVSVFKEGFDSVTIASQESQNLTVFLSGGTSPGGPPNVDPPSSGGGPAIIAGHVIGFKAPRPLLPTESERAEVWVVPTSYRATPPFSSMTSGAARDARGERWQITEDGGAFTVFAASGLRAVYAVYGIFDNAQQRFTPVLMGIRRGVEANINRPAVDQDIVLDMHLSQTVPVHLDRPASDPKTGEMAKADVYCWLELGAEGVIPLGSVATTTPEVDFQRLPQLDGASLLFLARSADGGGSRTAYTFAKQLGDLTGGLVIGPMLGLARIDVPSDTQHFEGQIRWSLGTDVAADVAQLWVFLRGNTRSGVILHKTASSWSEVATPPCDGLQAVWGSAPEDVWAVGLGGSILHLENGIWLARESPTTASLYGLWGSSATDVWAVGEEGTLARWDGTTWAVAPGPTTADLFSVWGSSADDVWAVGDKKTILHWDGTAWAVASSADAGLLLAVWGSGADDVWAAGFLGNEILHWDGVAWSSSTLPEASSHEIVALWGSSASDVWAIERQGKAFRWEGSAWTLVNVTASTELYGAFGLGALDRLWVAGNHGITQRWNGTTWGTEYSGIDVHLRALWASSETDLWAVGARTVALGQTSVWNVIVPGTQTSVAMPGRFVEEMLAASGPDDELYVYIELGRAARFDWAHWTYQSLSTGTWTSWTSADGTGNLYKHSPLTP